MAYTINTKDDIGKGAAGSEGKTGAMVFKAPAPLDDRFTVKHKMGLICKEIFGSVVNNEYTTGTNWVYPGLVTSVIEGNELYVLRDPAALILEPFDSLKNLSDAQIQAKVDVAWTRMAKASEVTSLQDTVTQNMQDLAGVFQFKGIAEAIDADHTTITLKSGSKTVSGSDPVTGYVCNGFYYDMAHDKYYEWSKDADTIYVNGTKVYTKSNDESTVYYVDYADSRYYASKTVSGKITEFTNLNGDVIYPAGDGINSETAVVFYADSGKTVSIGSLSPHAYNAYIFAEVSGVTFSGSAVTPGEGANGNNGHVYQIGEKEYASNGYIWVELGSPKQELGWLVL